MEEVSTAALFALRDFMLSDTRLLIHILSIVQRQLTDYFDDDQAKILRAFYNLGSLLYFINKAVNMGFDFDGVIASRLALVRLALIPFAIGELSIMGIVVLVPLLTFDRRCLVLKARLWCGSSTLIPRSSSMPGSLRSYSVLPRCVLSRRSQMARLIRICSTHFHALRRVFRARLF